MRADTNYRVTVLESLSAIPHLSHETWSASSLLARWLIASRAAVLIMTFSAAAVGGSLASLDGYGDIKLWSICLVGLLLAHAANNQLNDLTDSLRGIDKGDYFRNQYGVHVIEDGLLTVKQLLLVFAGTGGTAASIGIYLSYQSDSNLLWFIASGAFILLTYTYPLKQLGLGEIAVLLVWGPLMTGGTYLVMTGHWSVIVALVGTVFALGPTLVIFGKHIDKEKVDRVKGIGTLPVRIGESASRNCVIAMVVIQYLGLLALISISALPWPTLLALLAIPKAFRTVEIFRVPRPKVRPSSYPEQIWPLWFSSFAFGYTRTFSLLFLAGLLMSWMMAAV